MIVSVYMKELDAAHRFILEHNIADEEFVQFMPEGTITGGVWVVLRMRASRRTALPNTLEIHDGYER